jgi:hypothetical protein
VYSLLQFLKSLIDAFVEITALISSFQRIIETLREMKDDMQSHVFRCDNCSKEYLQSLRMGCLPPDWFTLTKGSSGLMQQDKHFCCIECLIKWTATQTIDVRKFDAVKEG